MVVWNTFETDARVTKEATSLIQAGKDVTVVAVHQPNRTLRKETTKGISIVRVDRTVRKRETSASNTTSNRGNITVKPSVSKLSKIKKSVRSFFRFVPQMVINVRFFLEAYSQNAGIYHAHDLNTLIPVYLASRLRGAKLVYDAHEVSTDRAGWKNKRYWEFVEGFLIRRAEKVITTNLTRAEYFKKVYHIDLPFIIRNVPPFEQITHSDKLRHVCHISSDEPIILYQGGMQRDRGIENMIKVIPLVKTGKFVFLGNGKLKGELISLVEEMGLQERVYFLEAVPNDELLEYTSSATIGLQLLINTCFNHYSACSNKLNEYMMAGIPVVASDLPEIRRVVDEFQTGILVDPENLKEIANAINLLLDDKDFYQQCKNNTILAAKKNNWESERLELIRIYELN